MFKLKPLTPAGVDAALEKATRYRLLNEPREAESICRDVLEVDSQNRQAKVMLLLSLTDQFSRGTSHASAAQTIADELTSEYEKLYYSGIIAERRAKALLTQTAPGTGPVVYDWIRRAMDFFERAEKVRPEGDDDAILRWNTCVRIIERHDQVQPAVEDAGAVTLLE